MVDPSRRPVRRWWPAFLLLAVCLASLTGAVPAPDSIASPWEPLNKGLLAHASVTSLAFDPADPARMYAGTADIEGLWLSKTGGESWRPAPGELARQPVYALLATGAGRGRILAGAGRGLYTSVDGGRSWERVAGLPEEGAIYALAQAGDGSVWAAGDLPAIYRAHLGAQRGLSWETLEPLPVTAAVLSLLAVPQNGYLLAGTGGAGLYRSRDGGRTWQRVPEIGATFVAALAAGEDVGTVFARTRRGLFFSEDGGETRRQTASEVEERIDAVANGAEPGMTLLGTGEGILYRRGTDGTWETWGEGLDRPGLWAVLRQAPGSPARWFAGTEHGLYLSEDGALTWRPVDRGPGHPSVQDLAQSLDGALALANRDGVYLSVDGGASWSRSSDGLPSEPMLSVAVSRADTRRLYAGSAGSGLYRSDDGGRQWRPTGWTRLGVPALLLDPVDPDHLFIRVAFERVYESRDGGETWIPRWEGLGLSTQVIALAAGTGNPETLYAGATEGFFRSRDGGAAWKATGAELAGQTVFSIAAGEDAVLYAGATDGVYRSTDGGESWQRQGLEAITVTALALPGGGPGVFAGTRYDGVHYSDDGQNWRRTGLEGVPVNRILLTVDGRGLYAATERGVFRMRPADGRPDLPRPGLPAQIAPAGAPVTSGHPGLRNNSDSTIPAPGIAATPQPRDQVVRRMRYAVHTLDAGPRTLALADEAGFDTIVQLFSWRQIEPTEGQYHWQYPDEVVNGAEYYGLDLVVRLDQHPHWASDAPLNLNAPPDDLADYARFVHAVATRYRGRVLGYVIWNEPNLSADWGGAPPDPAGYVALLRAACTAIREADPAALVISAGLAPTVEQSAEAVDDLLYLDAMYRAGAAPYFDVLGAHPYGFGHPPDDPAGAHDGLNMARLAELRTVMARHGDAAKPVWATEMGWTVDRNGAASWQAVSEAQQAEYLADAFLFAAERWPWLGLLAAWNLADIPDGEWSGYSLLDRDAQPRPAYRALQALLGGDATRPAATATANNRYVVLADDAPAHLGDSQFSEPWMPLYGAQKLSTGWQGTVYLSGPGRGPWRLSMHLMQSNVWGNAVWVNGRRLEPAMPVGDFTNSWVSYTWEIPGGVLTEGPNEVRVTIARTLPLLQDERFAWDDLQFKEIILWR